jgi:hypothetical protein
VNPAVLSVQVPERTIHQQPLHRISDQRSDGDHI